MTTSYAIVFALLAFAASLQVRGEDPPATHGNQLTDKERYSKLLGEFNETVNNIYKKWGEQIKQEVDRVSETLEEAMMSARNRRSAEDKEADGQETLDKLNNAFDGLKKGFNSFVNNVTESQFYSDVSKQLNKLGDKIQDAGSSLKTSIQSGYNNLTAPAN